MVILVPPDAPTTIFTLFSLSKMMVGVMDDSGLLPETDEKHHFETCRLADSTCLKLVGLDAEQHHLTWPHHSFFFYTKLERSVFYLPPE